MHILELRGIRKAFGKTIALSGLDLSVREGEVQRSSVKTAPERAP